MAPLHPYLGDDPIQHTNLGTAHRTRNHSCDRTGIVEYSFNTLGFRGTEFDSKKRPRVYVFGESHAFGTGVEFEDCWTSQFVKRWAASKAIDLECVMYMNFAEPGASNANIARNLIMQCEAEKPDLVIVGLSNFDRTELHLGGRPSRIGPWAQLPIWDEHVQADGLDEEQNGLRRELLQRARTYYEYATDAQGMLETLRNILLIQYYCEAKEINAIATAECLELMDSDELRENESLGRMRSLIDARFLAPHAIGSIKTAIDLSSEGLHVGPRHHAQFADLLFDHYCRRERGCVGERVRMFYESVPFNFHGTPSEAKRTILQNPIAQSYPDLHQLLESGRVQTICEIGCGTGWMSGALAMHYPVEVLGVDFCGHALEQGRELASVLEVGDRLRFQQCDLFDLELGTPVDLVLSLGVLHHTADARGAFQHVHGLIRSDGHVYVGLYHEHGRRVFLEMFRRILDEEGESAAFMKFADMNRGRSTNQQHLESWFRDQVLHPHETQHTLAEVCEWLDSCSLVLRSTSINEFGPVSDLAALMVAESEYRARSHCANVEKGRFFPGFFTVLAQAPG